MATESQRTPEDDRSREKAREAVEDAVLQMLEAGFTPTEVKAEVDYAIETAE